MTPIFIDRRLQTCSDEELRLLWRDLAPILEAKRDPISGKLPRLWQRQLDEQVAEWKRRGVQLALFGDDA